MPVQINFESIMVKVGKAKKVKAVALRAADNLVKQEKEKLIQDFEDHIISREIKEGPEGANISATLPNGYGNLFSFIGFYAGDDPIQLVSTLLKQNIEIKNRNALFTRFSKGNTIELGFRVQMPTLRQLYKETPYPDKWGDKNDSWLEGIEHGIRGFESYLFDPNFETYTKSRSTAGLQAKTKNGAIIIIRDGIYNPVPYIEELLTNFIKGIKG